MAAGRKISNVIKMIYYFIALGITIYGVWFTYENKGIKWLPMVYIIASLLAFVFYDRDKRAAKNKMWRIPESTLHFLELMGGWIGAYWAQVILRHKTRKLSYQITFWLIVTLHAGFWADYAIFHFQGLSTLIQYTDIDFLKNLNLFEHDNSKAIREGTIEWSK